MSFKDFLYIFEAALAAFIEVLITIGLLEEGTLGVYTKNYVAPEESTDVA